jgi:hypothetical protein
MRARQIDERNARSKPVTDLGKQRMASSEMLDGRRLVSPVRGYDSQIREATGDA